MEFTLLFAALTGAAAAWVANRLLARAGRFDGLELERPTDLLIGAAAIGLVVGRLAAMIGDGVNPITNPADIIIVRAGVDTGFAALGALAALAWGVRGHLPEVSDALAPAALAGLAGWHAGCVWRGTCLGTVSDLPWAWAQAGSDVTRHPVEIYAAVGLAAAAWVVARLPRRPWLATGSALAAAALMRLITEPLRPSITGGPVGWYIGGVVLGLGIALASQTAGHRRTVGPGTE